MGFLSLDMQSPIAMCNLHAVTLDAIHCGVDKKDTKEGAVKNYEYPWVGVLFYTLYGELGETRSVTTVVLIHAEFVLGNSADIGPMPKADFRDRARVLLGEGWEREGRRVRNYLVHPEYTETPNSIAIIHLRQPVQNLKKIQPICPPPVRIQSPYIWILKFEDNLDSLKKQVLPAVVVPAANCREFYILRNLNDARHRPAFVKCAVSMKLTGPCVWGAGAVLAERDVWGRWQLLGLGVYGPGCGAPSRFLDMQRYFPWIEDSLDKFQRITISEINQHRYILRSGVAFGTLMRFGECDNYEKQNIIYRDSLQLTTNNNNVKLIKYNMTIYDSVQYTCMVFQLRHASASAELRVRHFCPRGPGRAACYAYKGTRFDLSVNVMFTEACLLDIVAYGLQINISLLHIEQWKWEEGTYYEDFRITPAEYRGPQFKTKDGFDSLDESMWVPDYNRWSTTPFDIGTTTPRYTQEADDEQFTDFGYDFEPTTGTPRTRTTKLKKFSKKTPPLTGRFWMVTAAALLLRHYCCGVDVGAVSFNCFDKHE
ncbi:uncharacterized protein LOC133531278 [Cydia pomonella]|uniref:uncharacterized protein LOC133531278 n=1 Tax=Cydia pomonella TaxID=82600 RepID=UPI002ADE20A0|nr:uncharacterized protein LOC133531278 [Cydia pomonella]